MTFSGQRLPQFTRQALWRTVSLFSVISLGEAACATVENGNVIALLSATAEPILAAVVIASRREISLFKTSFILFFIICFPKVSSDKR
ncbi:hypothetical protein GM30_19700 [Trabulsiella odontotermitis]|nr:hypothetical protein GM30_19700 [Trabulsiella odontotermitis]